MNDVELDSDSGIGSDDDGSRRAICWSDDDVRDYGCGYGVGPDCDCVFLGIGYDGISYPYVQNSLKT